MFFAYLNLKTDAPIINNSVWKEAEKHLKKRFSRSSIMDLVLNIIKTFDIANPQTKYIGDFKVYLQESKLEDFVTENLKTISVSTIHKVKGKEFDNIFLALNNFQIVKESKKRELYVAITRAQKYYNLLQ